VVFSQCWGREVGPEHVSQTIEPNDLWTRRAERGRKYTARTGAARPPRILRAPCQFRHSFALVCSSSLVPSSPRPSSCRPFALWSWFLLCPGWYMMPEFSDCLNEFFTLQPFHAVDSEQKSPKVVMKIPTTWWTNRQKRPPNKGCKKRWQLWVILPCSNHFRGFWGSKEEKKWEKL